MQSQAYSTTLSYSGPGSGVMQVANGITLAGQMLDITAAVFALFLIASLRAADRPRAHHHQWSFVPLVFGVAGGACFAISFLMTSWVLQSLEVFVALATTTVACLAPWVVYAVVHR
jgi:hypothetical protein